MVDKKVIQIIKRPGKPDKVKVIRTPKIKMR